MPPLLTLEKVLSQFHDKHGDRYGYSEVVFKGVDVKVKIICSEHGAFYQSPYMHRGGQGCPKCGRSKANESSRNRNKIIEATTDYKVCVKCGLTKHTEEFFKEEKLLHGVRSECKVCTMDRKKQLRVLRSPLPMFEYYRVCPGCGECKPIDEFYVTKNMKIHRCSECRTRDSALWRNSHKDEKKKASDKYYSNNRDEVMSKSKEAKQLPAIAENFLSKLTVDEKPENRNGTLFVRCKKCGEMFAPTRAQVKLRVACLNTLGLGEGHLYCSEECKYTCDVFNAHTKRKSERGFTDKARGCQITVKKGFKQLQCDEVGHNYCEKCGDIIDVDLHHTQQVAVGGDVNNPAGMVLLCYWCHLNLHNSC